MDEAFVIMRIGDPEMDKIWGEVYVPTIKKCGLEPKRVDKHNEGHLLTSEIAGFIKRAKIIVADLTAERPNCYLEVGYTMGIGKFANLILACKSGGNVHFDLSAYDIVRWNVERLDLFREELTKKIRYRLGVLQKGEKAISVEKKDGEIESWSLKERKEALNIYYTNKYPQDGHLETILSPVSQNMNKDQSELLKIARKISIHEGWHVGKVIELANSTNGIKPDKNGIRNLYTEPPNFFDYWMLRREGNFYMLRNFMEENLFKKPDTNERVLYFDSRIYNITDIFRYAFALFYELGLKNEDKIKIQINHMGLESRTLRANDAGRDILLQGYLCNEEETSFEITDTLENLKRDSVKNIYKAASDLFVLFNFAKFPEELIREMINKLKIRP